MKRLFEPVDRQVLQALLVSLCFMAGAAGLVLGLRQLGFDEATIREWMGVGGLGPWRLPLTMGMFTLLAFVGVPQFLLIAASVAVFGAWEGGFYAFCATLVSASVDFWLARLLGKAFLPRGGGEGFQRLSRFMSQRGFWASFLIRLIPSAPFIVINMVAGMCRIRYVSFFGGTALGILPKTVLIAFLGGSAEALVRGQWVMTLGFIILALVCLLGLILVARFYGDRAETDGPS